MRKKCRGNDTKKIVQICVLLFVFLLFPLAEISFSNVPQSFQCISTTGTIARSPSEFGVWFVCQSSYTIPSEASWVVAAYPDYAKPRENLSVILDWYSVHPPYEPFNPFQNQSDIEEVESKLKTISPEKFWGILFICEENYRVHIGFNDDVNTTWFGERLLGYPLYLAANPNSTMESWKDEMYLRMVRGFYNYFHEKTNVGLTADAGTLVEDFRNQSWALGVSKYYGEPAMDFIRKNFDFVILYLYTKNLEDFTWTKQYFSISDELFQKQEKFWILTRIWIGSNDINPDEKWEPESIALELKNCFDRNMMVMTYYWSPNPPLDEVWALMLKASQLYSSGATYYEKWIYGTNLLTGYVGNTYGWVNV